MNSKINKQIDFCIDEAQCVYKDIKTHKIDLKQAWTRLRALSVMLRGISARVIQNKAK